MEGWVRIGKTGITWLTEACIVHFSMQSLGECLYWVTEPPKEANLCARRLKRAGVAGFFPLHHEGSQSYCPESGGLCPSNRRPAHPARRADSMTPSQLIPTVAGIHPRPVLCSVSEIPFQNEPTAPATQCSNHLHSLPRHCFGRCGAVAATLKRPLSRDVC